MIPKEAFAAIAAVMALSAVFGWVVRGLSDKAVRGRRKPSRGREERSCLNCRYGERPWFLEPCDSCTGNCSGWEERR